MKDLKGELAMAVCRVWCGRMNAKRLRTRRSNQKSRVKNLELTAELRESLYQDAGGSSWKADRAVLAAWSQMSKGHGKDWSTSKEAERKLTSSVPFYSTKATSLLVGATHTQKPRTMLGISYSS